MNGSSITSNWRIISLPNFRNNTFVQIISLKVLMEMKLDTLREGNEKKNQNPFTSNYAVISLPDFFKL